MSEAPSGIRLRFSDGTAVECAVRRSPLKDRRTRKGTVEYWTATPVKDVPPALTYEVECDKLPLMTGFSVDLGLDDEDRTLLAWAPPQAGPAGGAE